MVGEGVLSLGLLVVRTCNRLPGRTCERSEQGALQEIQNCCDLSTIEVKTGKKELTEIGGKLVKRIVLITKECECDKCDQA